MTELSFIIDVPDYVVAEAKERGLDVEVVMTEVIKFGLIAYKQYHEERVVEVHT